MKWKSTINKLSPNAQIELFDLYQFVNQKDQVKKIENIVKKLKIPTNKKNSLSIGNKIGIGIGVSLGSILFFGGLSYFYWTKKQKLLNKKITKHKK